MVQKDRVAFEGLWVTVGIMLACALVGAALAWAYPVLAGSPFREDGGPVDAQQGAQDIREDQGRGTRALLGAAAGGAFGLAWCAYLKWKEIREERQSR